MATTLTNGGCVRLVGGGAGENGRARDTGPVAVDDRLSFHYNRQYDVTTTPSNRMNKTENKSQAIHRCEL